MATLPFTVDLPAGKPFTIYAEPNNINYFINGDLDPDTTAGVTNDQSSVSAHSREQYPGDESPVGVSSSTREYMVDPSRKSGNALPGKNFEIAALGEDDEVLEKRQFTYKGRWMDLHAFLMAEAAFPLFVWNSSGTRYSIAEAAGN